MRRKIRAALVAAIVAVAVAQPVMVQPAAAVPAPVSSVKTPWGGIYLFGFGLCSSLKWAYAQNQAAKKGKKLANRNFFRVAVLPCLFPPIGLHQIIHRND